MAELLARLKKNNPPIAKKVVEINIREPAVEMGLGMGAKAAVAPAAAAAAAEQPVAKAKLNIKKKTVPDVKIIDESMKVAFDRDTFLKSFQRPRVINTLAPASAAPIVPAQIAAPIVPAPIVEPEQIVVPAQIVEPVPAKTKKNTTRKLNVKTGTKKATVAAAAPAAGEVPAASSNVLLPAEETVEPPITEIKEKRRNTKKHVVGVKEGPLGMFQFGDTDIETRLGNKKESSIIIPASHYYMNNREKFINNMTALFSKYKKKLAEEAAAPATCPGDGDSNEFSLMTHQQIVRDYLNVYTPYRGLLLFHGLGSGKTCSSIAIAEGMKTSKPVIIMTPASLQVNYREELKKCGDELYRKNQFWEFITTKGMPNEKELVDTLSNILSITVEYIKKNGGAWLVNVTQPSNYDELSPSDKSKLDDQIEHMISYKYQFINYNNPRLRNRITELSRNNTINPFDNAVIIIDEAHNLIGRISNKIGKKKDAIALTLYTYLMQAKNVKIILLTGTPIINYPNEIGILFNILRGFITTWSFKLEILEQRAVKTADFQALFKSTVLGGNIIDLIEYKPASTTLVVTRNPFGFVNKTAVKDNTYLGVKLEIGERGEISDNTFLDLVTQILKKNKINIQANGRTKHDYKTLPDTLDDFNLWFIEHNGNLKNPNMFKRRILGLASYFRSAQESLMPRYTKSNPADFQVVKIEMSDFQFSIYEEARIQERKLEKENAKKKKTKKPGADDLYEKTVSTYRIFSRAFCNFVFPRPAITRPLPDKKNKIGEETNLAEAITTETVDEDALDALTDAEKAMRDEAVDDLDDLEALGTADALPGAADVPVPGPRISYKERIQNALLNLEKASDQYLTPEALKIYSPKFLHILDNINDPTHEGIHLIYTQFRSLEGIGILKLVLEANGYVQFKIKKIGETWELAIPQTDAGKPMFALYTGTETPEEKEIIRNVLNGAWKYVPTAIVKKLKLIAPNNILGKIIKVLMITSSGAEGISLKNVRYVHITEPYWHPVRIEQVIGRARRICSHQDLPVDKRTVNVFLYLMTFSKEQLARDDAIELKLHDKSRIDNKTPVSTDETLYEIASAKEAITNNILKAVKEASIDCALHVKSNTSEKLQCFTFGMNDDPLKFSYTPSYEDESSDAIAERNKKEVTWKAKSVTLEGVKYALNSATNEVYDFESYVNGNPEKVADLILTGKGKDKKAELRFILPPQ